MLRSKNNIILTLYHSVHTAQSYDAGDGAEAYDDIK